MNPRFVPARAETGAGGLAGTKRLAGTFPALYISGIKFSITRSESFTYLIFFVYVCVRLGIVPVSLLVPAKHISAVE
jgi:hypothetical protein